MFNFKVSKMYIDQLINGELVIKSEDLDQYFTEDELIIFCERIKNYILDNNERKNDECAFYIKRKKYVLTLAELLIQLYFLEPNIKYKVIITDDYMIEFNDKFVLDINSHIENVGKHFERLLIEKDKINELSFIFATINTRLVKLTEDFSPISTPTFDLFDVIDFCDRNPEFDRMLDTQLDDTMPYRELEQYMEDSGKRLNELIEDDVNNCLYDFVKVKRLSQDQVTQMFFAVGPRADGDNIVLPHVIAQSYLQGFQNAGDIYAEGIITRKALILKKKYVGESGYTSREIDLLTQNTDIDYSVKDCGTKHYLDFEVKTKDHLLMIINKNIITNKGLKRVTIQDTDLIGTRVKVRSYICCAIHERGKICKTCYGATSELKKDTVIGGLVSIKTMNPLSNMLMSAKHKSSTKTIDFNDEEIMKYFTKDESSLIIKDLSDLTEQIALSFEKDYIEELIERGDEDDDSSMSARMISNLKFVHKTKDPDTLEDIDEINDVYIDSVYLNLSSEIIEDMAVFEMAADSDEALLYLNKLKPDTNVFDIVNITEETSRYLKSIKRILSRPKTEAFTDYVYPTQTLADLLIDAGLNRGRVELTHVEAIVYNLIRDGNDVLRRPDFTQNNPFFTILNLETAIFKGDLYTGLVFQEISSQLLDTDCYRKYGKGIHDSQFRTSKLYDYSKYEKLVKKNKLGKKRVKLC